MQIELQTDKSRYRFNDVIRCCIVRTDVSPPQRMDGHYRCAYLLNGREVYYEESERRDFQQLLWDYGDAIGTVCRVDFQVKVCIGRYPETVSACSPVVSLEIDLSGIEILPAPSSRPSCYVRVGRSVYFAWPYSRGHGKHHRKVHTDADRARALSIKGDFGHYLVDAERVFRDGILLKDVKAHGFQIYNPIFAGDGRAVLTPYGNAKVAHPEHFEVLDDGNQGFFTRSQNDLCRAGYGRDSRHVYWFDASNSTAHAIVVKDCKDPRGFVSLGLGYGRDMDHVYLEGRRVKGADPVSWRMLNRRYSRDDKHVFYLVDKVNGADLETFELTVDEDEQDLFESLNARDRHTSFVRGVRCLSD